MISLAPVAAVLAIGDELILGQALDTNSAWLSDRLAALGVRVTEHCTVEDDLDLIAASIERLAARAGLVVITGGLGPTPDDLTRDAIAQVLGEPLEIDPGALSDLRAWFAGRDFPMPEANAIQAKRPASARMLANPHGTAPGLHATLSIGHGTCEIVCLPGPPREMRPMFESVVPGLLPNTAAPVAARLVRTFGAGESTVAEMLGDLLDRDADPLVGTTASGGIVTVRIRSERGDEAADLVDTAEQDVRARLGEELILSSLDPAEDTGHDPLVEVVSNMLRERRQTIGTVESCTAGGIGAALTDLPGSSAVYRGGLIVYDNEHKTALAGVDAALIERHGAVSAEVALAMAHGGLGRLRVDHCVSVTGIAGPDGGTEAKPVGTVWIAAAGGGTAPEARRFLMHGGRDLVRERSARSALGLVRLRLLGSTRSMLAEAERREG